ncbi:hypothetical protein IU483_30295 [Streptomyces gardneri]|nr:hypothetical protein [Streptomyces gardneri]
MSFGYISLNPAVVFANRFDEFTARPMLDDFDADAWMPGGGVNRGVGAIIRRMGRLQRPAVD